MKFSDVAAPPVPAYQNVREFGDLWEHVAARPHTRVLEIGSLFGGTLWYWSRLPDVEAVVSVDLPSDWPQVADGVREARPQWHRWFAEKLVDFTDISADSKLQTTFDEAKRWGPFDFAFIDGDHSYEGVKHDWLMYSPLVKPGGIVAFHDSWPNYDRHEPGVVQWVDELRHHLPSIEWTDPDGVGIIAFTVPS